MAGLRAVSVARGGRARPWHVAAVALLGYLGIFYVLLHHSGDIRDFAVIGERFVTQSSASAVLRRDPAYNYARNGDGYDGQFVYFIALDPANARYYVDSASYRYTRILYPMLARLAAFGKAEWTAFALVLVNLLAVTVGTWALAAWCPRHGLSPWYALVYAFCVGQVLAFSRDLTEVLAYALVALGVYVIDAPEAHPTVEEPSGHPQAHAFRRTRWLLSGLVFGLAGLTRETTLIFPAFYAVRLLAGNLGTGGRSQSLYSLSNIRNMGRAALFALVSFGPIIAWSLFLVAWLGSFGLSQSTGLANIPLSGVYNLYPLGGDALIVVESVVLPGLICLGAGMATIVSPWFSAWRRKGSGHGDALGHGHTELWLMSLNALLFVLLLPPPSLLELYAAGRISLGVVLSALLALPYIRGRAWFVVCGSLWVAPVLLYLLNPALELLHQV